MSQNKPILGSVNSDNDLKDVVKKFKAGFISLNGKDELLYENAIKLLDNQIRSNIDLVSKFSVEAAASKIIDSVVL
jgi:hypothetical protein